MPSLEGSNLQDRGGGRGGQNAPSSLPSDKRKNEFRATDDLLSRRQGPRGEPCQKLQRALDTSTVSAGGPAGERPSLLPLVLNWKTKMVSTAIWDSLRKGRSSATTSMLRASWRAGRRRRYDVLFVLCGPFWKFKSKNLLLNVFVQFFSVFFLFLNPFLVFLFLVFSF